MLLFYAGVAETAITGAGVVLVALTLRQAKRSADAAETSLQDVRESSRREFRAYLSVQPAKLERLNPNETIHFSFQQINSGKTPAYSCTQRGLIILAPHPLPEELPFPILDPTNTKTVALANLPYVGHTVAENKFTKDQIVEMLQGPAEGNRLYIFGQVDYIDAFKKPHWTRYCYSFPGWHEVIYAAAQDQWDGINQALSSGMVQLQFELFNRFNDTDEG